MSFPGSGKISLRSCTKQNRAMNFWLVSKWIQPAVTCGGGHHFTMSPTFWYMPMTLPFQSQKTLFPVCKGTTILWQGSSLGQKVTWGAALESGGENAPPTSCCHCRTTSFQEPSTSTMRMRGGKTENRTKLSSLDWPTGQRVRKSRGRTTTRRARLSNLMSRPWRRRGGSSGMSHGIVPDAISRWILLTLAGASGLFPQNPLMPITAQGNVSSQFQRYCVCWSFCTVTVSDALFFLPSVKCSWSPIIRGDMVNKWCLCLVLHGVVIKTASKKNRLVKIIKKVLHGINFLSRAQITIKYFLDSANDVWTCYEPV